MNDEPSFDLNLHIDELVLHGCGHLDRAELGTAVRSALIRLLGENGLPSPIRQGGQVARLDGAVIDLPAHAGTSLAGERIAQSIYRSLSS